MERAPLLGGTAGQTTGYGGGRRPEILDSSSDVSSILRDADESADAHQEHLDKINYFATTSNSQCKYFMWFSFLVGIACWVCTFIWGLPSIVLHCAIGCFVLGSGCSYWLLRAADNAREMVKLAVEGIRGATDDLKKAINWLTSEVDRMEKKNRALDRRLATLEGIKNGFVAAGGDINRMTTVLGHICLQVQGRFQQLRNQQRLGLIMDFKRRYMMNLLGNKRQYDNYVNEKAFKEFVSCILAQHTQTFLVTLSNFLKEGAPPIDVNRNDWVYLCEIGENFFPWISYVNSKGPENERKMEHQWFVVILTHFSERLADEFMSDELSAAYSTKFKAETELEGEW